MAITSHDVARLAGVSQPTVSRTLRDDSRVSAATREKVRRAAEALQYLPSEAGRLLGVGQEFLPGGGQGEGATASDEQFGVQLRLQPPHQFGGGRLGDVQGARRR